MNNKLQEIKDILAVNNRELSEIMKQSKQTVAAKLGGHRKIQRGDIVRLIETLNKRFETIRLFIETINKDYR